jgi:uncharacterized protein (DUF2141 family)
MHLSFILFSLFAILHVSSYAQVDVTIEINNLSNNKGKVLLEVYNGDKKVIARMKGNIEKNSCFISVNDLSPGRYAFRYFHDENDNEKLDTNWMGIPKEGFGFSNNALGTFGPPAFEKWIFELEADKKIICNPKYM